MFSISLLDEAASRDLTVPELEDRNRGLAMYVQPAKENSEWALVCVLQHSRRFTLASTAPLDAVHSSDIRGRSLFDTSSPRGRRALSDLLWNYMGLPSSEPELQRHFAETFLSPHALEFPIRVEPQPVIDWYAASKHRRSERRDAALAQEGWSACGAVETSSIDYAKKRRLFPSELDERCLGMIVDYERTSPLSERTYTGTVTVLQYGRQYRFDNVQWPKYFRSSSGAANQFVDAFSDLLGLHRADRKLMVPLLRRRFSEMFPARQAYYDVRSDLTWLVQSRTVQEHKKQRDLSFRNAPLPRPPGYDNVFDFGDFLPEPGDTSPVTPRAADERGSLPLATAPTYRTITTENALHLRL